MKFVLIREPVQRPVGAEAYTPGKLYANGVFWCFTLEDEDRRLEWVGTERKVNDRTAIPRRTYAMAVSQSQRFGKLLPIVLDVPGFSGVRIHGGNRAEDSRGCILVGQVRTSTGIAQCADSVSRITTLITRSKTATLEIK